MTLNSKQVRKVALVLLAVGALRELKKQEAYIPAEKVAARKRKLKEEIETNIDELNGKQSVKASAGIDKINLTINVPGAEAETSSNSFALKDVFKKLFGKEEKKDDAERVIEAFLDEEFDDLPPVVGRIVEFI